MFHRYTLLLLLSLHGGASWASAEVKPTTPTPPSHELSLLEQSERFWKDPTQRRTTTEHSIRQNYEPYLKELNLAPDRLERLKAILVDQFLALWSRIDDIRDKHAWTNTSHAEEHARMVRESISAMEGLLSPSQLAMLQRGLEADYYVNKVRANFARSCAEQHIALSGTQVLTLAYAEYLRFDPKRHPQAKYKFELPLNEQGLTLLEAAILRDVAGILSPEQLSLLTQQYQSVQRRVRESSPAQPPKP